MQLSISVNEQTKDISSQIPRQLHEKRKVKQTQEKREFPFVLTQGRKRGSVARCKGCGHVFTDRNEVQLFLFV